MTIPIKSAMDRADEHFDTSIREMYFMQIAEVILYDAPTRKAQLKLVVKQPDLEGEVLLEDIAVKQPVMSPNWMVDCEVPTGTHGLLFFADNDFHHWLNTGQITDPPTTYFHQISQCIFIPGILNDTEQRPGVTEGVQIRNNDGSVSMTMTNAGISMVGSLHVDGQINSTGNIASDTQVFANKAAWVSLTRHTHKYTPPLKAYAAGPNTGTTTVGEGEDKDDT